MSTPPERERPWLIARVRNRVAKGSSSSRALSRRERGTLILERGSDGSVLNEERRSKGMYVRVEDTGHALIYARELDFGLTYQQNHESRSGGRVVCAGRSSQTAGVCMLGHHPRRKNQGRTQAAWPTTTA